MTISASEQVIDPLVDSYTVLFGKTGASRADESVTIEARECGLPDASWRPVAVTQTTDGGAWSWKQLVRTTTTYRVRWKDSVSSAVTVRARPWIYFRRRATGFDIRIGGGVQAWAGKRVIVQRYDPRLGRWTQLTTVVLHSWRYAGAGAREGLRFKAPKGTRVRVAVPLTVTRPCFLNTFSVVLRV